MLCSLLQKIPQEFYLNPAKNLCQTSSKKKRIKKVLYVHTHKTKSVNLPLSNTCALLNPSKKNLSVLQKINIKKPPIVQLLSPISSPNPFITLNKTRLFPATDQQKMQSFATQLRCLAITIMPLLFYYLVSVQNPKWSVKRGRSKSGGIFISCFFQTLANLRQSEVQCVSVPVAAL